MQRELLYFGDNSVIIRLDSRYCFPIVGLLIEKVPVGALVYITFLALETGLVNAENIAWNIKGNFQ